MVSVSLSFISIVKVIQILSIFTPLFLLAFGLYNKEKVLLADSFLIKRWGSLYEEFKNNKGFVSCQFYSLFLLRRLIYAFSQTFLNDFIYFQQALNIFGTLVQTFYLIYFFPLKDCYIGATTYIGEICTLLVMITSLFFSESTNESTIKLLEYIIIFSVLGTIVIQTLISFVLLGKSISDLCIRYKKFRISQILRNTRKILPLDSNNKEYDNSDPSNFRNTEQKLNIEEIT